MLHLGSLVKGLDHPVEDLQHTLFNILHKLLIDPIAKLFFSNFFVDGV